MNVILLTCILQVLALIELLPSGSLIGPTFAHAEISIPKQSEWLDWGIILESGPPGSWDVRLAGMISPCTVVKKNGTYFLYYIGADGDRSTDRGPRHRALGVATSTDGINFSKYNGNPIITYSPHNNEEEGAFSAAGALDKNGNVLLCYGAMDAGSQASQSVDSDVRLAVSTNGLDFEDIGDVVSHADVSVWGHGDELFPVGVLHAGDTWYVYYIAKGHGAFWDLGVAWGPSPTNLPYSQAVLTAGSYIIGGGNPVWLESDKIGLFIVRDFRRPFVEIWTASSNSPGLLDGPVKSYNLRGHGHTTVFFDKEINAWFMYQLKKGGNAIRVMTVSS